MVNAWTALLSRNALADAQRDRTLLKRCISRWLDRVIDVVRIQKAADDGRANLRKAIQRASWGSAAAATDDYDMDDGRTVSASRASSVTLDSYRSRRTMEDDEYLRAIEQVRPITVPSFGVKFTLSMFDTI